jgi:hypothetical protein
MGSANTDRHATGGAHYRAALQRMCRCRSQALQWSLFPLCFREGFLRKHIPGKCLIYMRPGLRTTLVGCLASSESPV